MENLEVYKFSGNLYFINNDTKQEGKIILGAGNRGNEFFNYVSHLEECDEITEEEQDQIIEYLEKHFELIQNAKEL